MKNINWKKVIILLSILIVICIVLVFGINYYVKYSAKDRILIKEEIIKKDSFDCILILGAGVNGEIPSPILKERLDMGIELYELGVAPKIIMSGDHGKHNYDEVNIMKQYAVDRGIPSEDIFMDHAGFSTYDSIYRAKDIFEVNSLVIVTQEYHLYRALYISKKLGLDAYGVASDKQKFYGQIFREIREIAARDKDFIKTIFKPKPIYLGHSIPVSGNGDVTNDKEI